MKTLTNKTTNRLMKLAPEFFKDCNNNPHPFIRKKFGIIGQYILTPEFAANILDHFNHTNPRPLDLNEAKKIARAIEEGRWNPFTALPLCFEVNTGILLDGQTRAAAVVLAGKPVTTTIAYGVPRDTNSLRDVSRRRTTGVCWASILGLGHDAVPKLSQACAVSRVWKNFLNQWKPIRFDHEELISFYQSKQSVIDPFLVRRENTTVANRAGFRAACAFYSTVNREKAQIMFDKVSGNGAGLKANSPILILREHLRKDVHQGGQSQIKQDFTATLAMCWAFEHDEKVKAICYKEVWP